jgi:predicted nucleotidyltransferase
MAEPRKILSIEEIRERLVPLFKERDLRLILLFGSALTGAVHKKSDIDLAFLFDSPMDIVSITNNVIRLLHTDSVDVIDLKQASPLLKYSVAQKGRPLYEKSPGIFNEFYSLAFRMYVDTRKLRDARTRGIKYFLETRGLV